MIGNTATNASELKVSEPGLPALVKRLNAYWRLLEWNRKADCDMLDDPRSMLTTLAIPLDKAHELWGYGHKVAAEPETTSLAEQPRTRGALWSDDDLAKLLQDLAVALGKTKRAKYEALATDRGVKWQTIKKYVDIAQDRRNNATQLTPFSGLGQKKR